MTRGRLIVVRDIIGNQEVRDLCGGIMRHTLISWRKTQGFPAPVRTLKCGEIWDRKEVREWLELRRVPDRH